MSLEACLGGVVPPICTPLTEEGELDVASLLALRARLVEAGVAGIFALGSTGEASYLSDELRLAVVEVLAESSRQDGLPLLVGLLEPTADRAVVASRSLVVPGVCAAVATGPFYASASESEIRQHFEMIAADLSVPVLAYNIPPNVGYELPVGLLQDLLERRVIRGVKDSSPNLTAMRQLIPEAGTGDVAYFSGSDWLLDAALTVGVNGSVAGLANVAPQLFVEALRAHAEGDGPRLEEAQRRIAILAQLYTVADPGAGTNSTQLGSIKTALRLQGVIASDYLTPPMQRSSTQKVRDVEALLVAAGVRG